MAASKRLASKQLPEWISKILLLERGYTEREADEEFTLETLARWNTYQSEINRVKEELQRKAESKARAGNRAPSAGRKPRRR